MSLPPLAVLLLSVKYRWVASAASTTDSGSLDEIVASTSAAAEASALMAAESLVATLALVVSALLSISSVTTV